MSANKPGNYRMSLPAVVRVRENGSVLIVLDVEPLWPEAPSPRTISVTFSEPLVQGMRTDGPGWTPPEGCSGWDIYEPLVAEVYE